MHCARLGFQCIELLETGGLQLPLMTEAGDWLRAVRHGEVDFDDWWDRVLELDAQLESMLDNTAYPAATSMATLSPSIEPSYITTLPPADGWGRAFSIDSAAIRYTVWSGGSDGGALNYVGGPTSSMTESIVFSNGRFAQWPEGQQSN